MKEKIEVNHLSKINGLISHIENHFLGVNKTADNHFCYIKSLLKQSLPWDNEEINIAKIYEAVHYIESIQIETLRYSFFYNTPSATPMSQFLAKRGEIILPSYERIQQPVSLKHRIEAVPANTENQFGSLHKELVGLISNRYQFLKDEKLRKTMKKVSVIWNYDYPVNEDKEVMNQAIGEWQANLMNRNNKNSDSKIAYRDFKRDMSIRGLIAKTDSEADDLLDYLVKGSAYPKENHETIKTWLQRNGGQDINRFLDTLMLNGDFTSQESASLLSTQGIQQGWMIENGKIVLSYESVVYSILINGEVKTNDHKGRLVTIDAPETIKDSEGNFKVLPLMHVSAKVELNLSINEVTPSITALAIESYSCDLSKPAVHVLPIMKI
ncbi:hypothetical protein [Legionella feeleii]|uniref:Uncharacterized protein n=1 Tax=Legionella feeleii TaxID=453 RepID=A0A378KKC7_9GAMM|nr:hypothetical protein [Legionella feeleii]STX88263.1 Uncharacterised protein [Legionella feeleii]STX88288.1 Uncharacterised protein [Legionella feeleii]